jgi:putative ABC transport system permease protein
VTLWQDLRYAVRLLTKDRWFTAVAVVALALGIGANAAVFTFVNAVLLRGLPFDEPDRIVALGGTDARGRPIGVSRLDYLDIKEAARSYSGLTLILGANVNVADEGRPAEQFTGSYNSANLFQLIGQRPVIGRDFRPEDDLPGAEPTVILGNGIWKSRYGSDPAVIGHPIKINTLVATIVGVMAPDMKFPFNNDIWVPVSMLPPTMMESKRGVRSFQVMARLSSGVTLAQARAEVESISARLAHDFPDTNKDVKPSLTTYNERVTGPQIPLIFWSLMGAVAFVLLIACANVANLLLARSAQRSREIAVRVSLGASRWRIVRQLLAESLLLAIVSALLGLLLALGGIRIFDAALTDQGKPYWMTFTMDGIVFVFLGTVCVGTAILFGLAPALHVSKTDVNEVMKEGGGRSGTGGLRARRWTSALIVIDVVLTLVLLAGAGFMMRSFLALYTQDLGIDTVHLVTMRLSLPLTKYPKPDPRTQLFQRLEERMRANGQIQSSAIVTNLPLQGGFTRQLTVEGRANPIGMPLPEVTVVGISAGYFDALKLPIVRGRGFSDTDGTSGHESAIVNQRFVAMHFSGEDPIGRRLQLADSGPPRPDPSPALLAPMIVGIVPNVRQRNFQEPDPDPIVYLPYRADPQRFANLIVRSTSDTGRITTLVREEMRAVEPDIPLFDIQTMDARLAQMRWPMRVFGSMFAIFAVIALVLSAVGLYAVTAYSVAQRTSEIGIRMALGAQPEQVLWLVLRRSLLQLAIGLPIGMAGAFGVGRLLQSVLVQTSGRDPLTIAAIALLMVVVSIAACFWPARRATRLDPVSALRYE